MSDFKTTNVPFDEKALVDGLEEMFHTSIEPNKDLIQVLKEPMAK